MKYIAFLVLILGLPILAHATTTDTSFVPLTNIPFLTEPGNPFSLESFLNGLYRIAIGAAAVIAVLQIMRAGILYMGESVMEKKEAKGLIGMAIGGLILVLSPVIVFSIINPEILSLKIGGIEELRSDLTTLEAGATWESTASGARALCIAQGGTVTEPSAGTIRCVAATGGSCPSYPVGTSTVSSAQQSCCSAQDRCVLQADTKSQYRCICTAP